MCESECVCVYSVLQYRRCSVGGSAPGLSAAEAAAHRGEFGVSSVQFGDGGDDDGPAGLGSGRGGSGGFGRDQYPDPLAAAAESTAGLRSESGSAQSAVHLELLDPSRGDPLLPAAGGPGSRDPARPVPLTVVHTPVPLCTVVHTPIITLYYSKHRVILRRSSAAVS